MIQATLYLKLNIKKCISSFYPKYTKTVDSLKSMTKEEWESFVKKKDDPEKYLFSILHANKTNIKKDLNAYVNSLAITGVSITEFDANINLSICTKVNYKEFLKCTFMKENLDEKTLASMRLVPFPETIGVPLGNKLQKSFIRKYIKF